MKYKIQFDIYYVILIIVYSAYHIVVNEQKHINKKTKIVLQESSGERASFSSKLRPLYIYTNINILYTAYIIYYTIKLHIYKNIRNYL